MSVGGYRPYAPQGVPVRLDDGIWTVEGGTVPYKAGPVVVPCPTRSTLIADPLGGIWLHSPIAYSRGLHARIEALAARSFYEESAFVRVTAKPPQTKWATGSNFVFVSYAADRTRNLVIALAAFDNLGKGAAGQAIQNANLMCGLPEAAVLSSVPVGP